MGLRYWTGGVGRRHLRALDWSDLKSRRLPWLALPIRRIACLVAIPLLIHSCSPVPCGTETVTNIHQYRKLAFVDSVGCLTGSQLR
jgi:hypothetical protein